MSAKLTSADAVIRALASGSGLTGPEIAGVTGLGRSTVSKALVALERRGMVRRQPGGRDGRRRLPDVACWATRDPSTIVTIGFGPEGRQ